MNFIRLEQLKILNKLVKTMDSLLEAILFTQFGIEDEKWIESMKALEEGYEFCERVITEKI